MHLKQKNAGKCLTLVVAYNWRHFRGSLDWPAKHWSSSHVLGWLQPAFGWYNAFQVAELRSSLYRLTSSQCFDVVSKQWNLQIVVNLPVTNVPSCVSRNAKTLCNTSSCWTWVSNGSPDRACVVHQRADEWSSTSFLMDRPLFVLTREPSTPSVWATFLPT
jgi:hypothetical protein